MNMPSSVISILAAIAFPCFAQPFYAEKTIGSVHLIAWAVDPSESLPAVGINLRSSNQKGLMVSLMSDDAAVSRFNVTVAYRIRGQVLVKTIAVEKQNNPGSAWSNEVLWFGTEPYSVLSIAVQELHPETHFGFEDLPKL